LGIIGIYDHNTQNGELFTLHKTLFKLREIWGGDNCQGVLQSITAPQTGGVLQSIFSPKGSADNEPKLTPQNCPKLQRQNSNWFFTF